MLPNLTLLFFFFFNDPATTEIYPLPLHDALPISAICQRQRLACPSFLGTATRKIRRRPTRTRRQSRPTQREAFLDRKSTRLNSSHGYISYAVFCLKKKKKQHMYTFCPTIDNSRAH